MHCACGSQEHSKRRFWNWCHWWCGRIIIGLAIANVYMGLHLAGEQARYYICYSVVLGAIAALWFLKELWDLVRMKRPSGKVSAHSHR